MFAQRLKELRNETKMTQVQLAEKLGVSKGTVAMWEIGKREPNFDTINKLSEIFDRRIDYILGFSNDASYARISEEDIDQLGRWAAEDSMQETVIAYLQLDCYGKQTVESVIKAEIERCREQESLYPVDNFRLSLQIRKENTEE